MEPLSLVAGVISLVGISRKAIDTLSLSNAWKGKSDSLVLLETQVCVQLLDEMGQITLSRASAVPQSAVLSLRLCERHLSFLQKNQDLSSLEQAYKKSSILQSLKEFRRAVKLLRDIVMDSLTHNYVQEHMSITGRGFGEVRNSTMGDVYPAIHEVSAQMEATLKRIIIPMLETLLTSSAARNTANENGPTDDSNSASQSEDVINQLREALKRGQQDPAQKETNPFEFSAKVLHEDSQVPIQVCATLDTGSKENWISREVVSRAGLDSQIVPAEGAGKIYVGFGGEHFQSAGSVDVTWTRFSAKSWKTTFLINSGAPFDLILGRQFIIQEGLEVFGEPVLVNSVTRLGSLSKDDYREMEVNMRTRGAQGTELTMTRAARDAAARQKRREERQLPE
jgi:hypothetical protein